nr:MAG TPA: hypothetical protein [Caudoviricetes sp.]
MRLSIVCWRLLVIVISIIPLVSNTARVIIYDLIIPRLKIKCKSDF